MAVMSNSPQQSKVGFDHLPDVLQGLFQTIALNRSGIEDLLKKLKELRQEYVEVLPDIAQKKVEEANESSPSEMISAQALMKTLQRFREAQEISYKFLQDDIRGQILDKIAAEAMIKQLADLSSVSDQLKKVTEERNRYKEEALLLQKSEEKIARECKTLTRQKRSLDDKVEELNKENETLLKHRGATSEYEKILREIRKEIEHKKELDNWRLKVLYNKFAALTGSSWSCPGIPKPDHFVSKSEIVNKFLESL